MSGANFHIILFIPIPNFYELANTVVLVNFKTLKNEWYSLAKKHIIFVYNKNAIKLTYITRLMNSHFYIWPTMDQNCDKKANDRAPQGKVLYPAGTLLLYKYTN